MVAAKCYNTKVAAVNNLVCACIVALCVIRLSFCVFGTAEYRFTDGSTLRVGAGDAVFLSEESRYSVITSGEYHHYTVNFHLNEALSSELLSPLGVTAVRCVNAKLYSGLFASICGIWKNKGFGYELRAASVLYSILSELFLDLCSSRTDTSALARISPAKEFMDTHPTESVSVAFLAGLVRMSETNFRREFLRIFGTSPMKYRDALLISHARDALISGEYTVSEAAYVCGFSDPSYFARFFKKHTGMSPREFEKRGL